MPNNKAIFLERDNTLIRDSGYISSVGQVELLEGVSEALIELKEIGYKLVVVTNQPAIARGIITEKTLEKIHKRLKELLAENGARLDAIYYCSFHPKGSVAKYRKDSNMRKPEPGMLLKAAEEIDINLDESWAIGNSSSDILAGLRAGCKTILLDHPARHKELEFEPVNPDYHAVNLKEAVNIIKKHLRKTSEQQDKADSTIPEEPQLVNETVKQPEETKTAKQLSPQHHTKRIRNNIRADSVKNDSKELLGAILRELKTARRVDETGDFSVIRLLAGFVQMLVLFFLLACVYFLMATNKQDNNVLISLGFAIVFQLMALTFYIMRIRK